MPASLDRVLRGFLHRFTDEIFKRGWRGREREAISLYAFGYLARNRSGLLRHPGQIGIEVAIPQLPGRSRKRQVCKDLVIWPRPMMTCWDKAGAPVVHPLAVVQWKTCPGSDKRRLPLAPELHEAESRRHRIRRRIESERDSLSPSAHKLPPRQDESIGLPRRRPNFAVQRTRFARR